MKELVRKFSPTLFIILETHIPFSSVSNFWDKLGFEAVGIMEANGHSGGIWVLACKGRYRYQVVDIFQQCVTVKLSHGDKHWLCSATYGSPTPSI